MINGGRKIISAESFVMIKSTNVSLQDSAIIALSCLGLFLSTLDSGIINVALPYLSEYFEVPVSTMSWAISTYFLTLGSFIVLFGKVADWYCRGKIYLIGLLIFGIGSVLCACSKTCEYFILSRIIQAVGASILQATAVSLVTVYIKSSSRKATAMGLIGVSIGLGPIMGPAISGLILNVSSWRLLFLINVPLCIIGLILYRLARIRSIHENTGINLHKLKQLASLVLLFMLSASLSALALVGSVSWVSVKYLIINIFVLAALLFLNEKRNTKKLFEPSMLVSYEFYIQIVGTFMYGLCIAIVLMSIPVYLSEIIRFPPWIVGVVAFSAPLGIVTSAHFSGRNSSHESLSSKIIVLGILLMFCSSLALYLFSIHTWLTAFTLTPILFLFGLGGGLFQPINIFKTLNLASKHFQSTTAAVNRMVHNLSNGFGVLILSYFISTSKLKYDKALFQALQLSWQLLSIVTFSVLIVYVIFYYLGKRNVLYEE